jgi:hypothetical protein
VFLKMPDQWKFVGQLDPPSLRMLPPWVHTCLLSDGRGDVSGKGELPPASQVPDGPRAAHPEAHAQVSPCDRSTPTG